MSQEDKSAPLSCRNSEIPKGKINKMTEFFNQQALKAKVEREIKIQSFHKRKNSSGNNSREKTSKNEMIQRSPSGKDLLSIKGSTDKKPHFNIDQPQFSNIDFNDSELRNYEPLENIPSDNIRRYTLPVNQQKSGCYTIIFKDELEVTPEISNPIQEKVKHNKRRLNLQIDTTYNDDEEKSIIKTKIDTLKDSLKRYTPKTHNFVIKFNESNNYYDVIPLSHNGFSILGKDNMERSNLTHSVKQEIYFELLKEFSSNLQNTIETPSEIRREVERSPSFSEFTTIENHLYELDNSRLNDKVTKKWKKEIEIIKQCNDLYIAKNVNEFLVVQERIADLSIIVKAKKSEFSISSTRIEFPIIKLKKCLFYTKENEFMIICHQKEKLILSNIKNEEFSYYQDKQPCDCLTKWKSNLNIQIFENYIFHSKRYQQLVTERQSYEILVEEKQPFTTIEQSSSLDILCKKIHFFKEVNTHKITFEGSMKNSDLEVVLNESISILQYVKLHEIANFQDKNIQYKIENEITTFVNISILGIEKNLPINKGIIDVVELRTEEFMIIKDFKSEEKKICQFDINILSDVPLITKRQENNKEENKAQEIFSYHAKIPFRLEVSNEISYLCCNLDKKYEILYVTNEFQYEYNVSDRREIQLRSISSSKDSGSTSPEKAKEMIIKEVQQFNLKGDVFEKEILLQETANSLFFQKVERPISISRVEEVTISCIPIIEKLDICMLTSLEICRERKKFILIESEKSDIWRSFKISIFSMIFLTFITCMIIFIFTHLNIKNNFSNNYFKNQSLFKWEIIYSGN